MTFLFLFLYNAFSKKVNLKMDAKKIVYELPDFGFEKGGRLYVTLFGSNLTGVKLFVLSPILKSMFYTTEHSSYFCSGSLDFFFGFKPHFQSVSRKSSSTFSEDEYEKLKRNKENAINKNGMNDLIQNDFEIKKFIQTIEINDFIKRNDLNFKNNSGIGYIALNVVDPNIYLPLLTNCHKHEKITALIQYTNKDSFIDSREKHCQLFYTITEIVYLVFMLIWIINGICYPKFNITIHYLFAFSCLSKIFSLYFLCLKWKYKQKSEILSNMVNYGEIVSRCFAFVVLMTTNISCSLGFGVYKKTDCLEVVLIMFISLFLFLSIYTVEENFNDMGYYGLFLSFIFLAIVLYLLATGINTIDSFPFQLFSIDFFRKINLISDFCVTFLITLILYAGVIVFYFFLKTKMSNIMMIEYTELLFYIIDIIYFLYRNSYQPTRNLIHELMNVHDSDQDLNNNVDNESNDNNNRFNSENSNIVVIDDPNKSEIKLISTY